MNATLRHNYRRLPLTKAVLRFAEKQLQLVRITHLEFAWKVTYALITSHRTNHPMSENLTQRQKMLLSIVLHSC